MRGTLLPLSLAAAVSMSIAAAQSNQQPVNQQQTASRPSAGDIQSAVARLRTMVQDPFATEATLATARTELIALRTRANESVPASDKDVAGPVAAAQLEIQNLLTTIDARLGPAPDMTAGRTSRAARAAGLSVPAFDTGRGPRDLADAVRAAHGKLSEQLRTAPLTAQPTEAALVDMIVAEERLAWQAGWPFAPDEQKELKDLKDQASKAPKGDAAARNEIDRRIGEVYARRRARGVSAINAQLALEAHSVGREAPPPFVIHRPMTRSGQRAVEQRLAELISTETGLQVQPGGPAVVLLATGTRPFDEALAGTLRGDR